MKLKLAFKGRNDLFVALHVLSASAPDGRGEGDVTGRCTAVLGTSSGSQQSECEI